MKIDHRFDEARKKPSKLEKLKTKNTIIRCSIRQEVGNSTMELVNDLIDNELQQQELCNE